MPLASVGIVVAALVGWADITVSPSRGDRIFSAWQQTVGNLDRPSERTVETLKRYELDARFRRDPEGTLARLEGLALRSLEPELVYAMAELSWIEGRRLEGRRFGNRGSSALDRYIDTVAYAWDYLFDARLAGGRQAFDPRYQLACHLYNGGLDRLIRAAKTRDRIQPGETIALKIHGKEQSFRLNLENSPWTPRDIDELALASDFEVTGLDSRSRQFGLGVPLIGIRHSETPGKRDDRFYPPEMAYPLTAVLRPNARLGEIDPDSLRECTLDLVDPIQFRSLGQGREGLELEADITTPLAFMWSRTDLSKYRWTGLLRPGEAAGRAGLMLLRPYDPDKIPVVMVHGLASSPLAWIPMLNELLREPTIQKRYQFLLYVYPTGVPVPIAAAGLRDALVEAQRTFDTAGTLTPEYEFRQMVLLGHSMGGLLSHAMVVHSDNLFWGLSTDRSFDEISGPPEVLAELRHYTFFEPMPFVKRVVFLATPHRGSELARRVVGRVSSNLISEPDHYGKLLSTLLKDNPDAFDRRRFRHLPTSIDTLEPNADVLLALLKMRPAEDVKFHSIIGSLRPVPLRETTDGVVSYSSSHLDGVLSEKVVRSDHGVQKDAAAILEVRRILMEHIGAVSAPARIAVGTESAGSR